MSSNNTLQYLSKYQKKHFEEIVYELDEHQCPKCRHWFLIDERFCPSADDGQELNWDFVRIVCPYCNHKWLYHL